MGGELRKHVLVVLSNPVAGREDEFNAWYTGQHLPDVLRVPGFVAAQRFAFAGEGEHPWKYLAIYEVETADVAATLATLMARAGTPDMAISSAMSMTDYQLSPWVAVSTKISA